MPARRVLQPQHPPELDIASEPQHQPPPRAAHDRRHPFGSSRSLCAPRRAARHAAPASGPLPSGRLPSGPRTKLERDRLYVGLDPRGRAQGHGSDNKVDTSLTPRPRPVRKHREVHPKPDNSRVGALPGWCERTAAPSTPPSTSPSVTGVMAAGNDGLPCLAERFSRTVRLRVTSFRGLVSASSRQTTATRGQAPAGLRLHGALGQPYADAAPPSSSQTFSVGATLQPLAEEHHCRPRSARPRRRHCRFEAERVKVSYGDLSSMHQLRPQGAHRFRALARQLAAESRRTRRGDGLAARRGEDPPHCTQPRLHPSLSIGQVAERRGGLATSALGISSGRSSASSPPISRPATSAATSAPPGARRVSVHSGRPARRPPPRRDHNSPRESSPAPRTPTAADLGPRLSPVLLDEQIRAAVERDQLDSCIGCGTSAPHLRLTTPTTAPRGPGPSSSTP